MPVLADASSTINDRRSSTRARVCDAAARVC